MQLGNTISNNTIRLFGLFFLFGGISLFGMESEQPINFDSKDYNGSYNEYLFFPNNPNKVWNRLAYKYPQPTGICYYLRNVDNNGKLITYDKVWACGNGPLVLKMRVVIIMKKVIIKQYKKCLI